MVTFGPINETSTTVRTSRCEIATSAPDEGAKSSSSSSTKSSSNSSSVGFGGGMNRKAEGDFHHLFPRRQLWQPKVEYPLWDNNWDGRHPSFSPGVDDPDEHRRRMRTLRHTGVTRHIILVRHGQYQELEQEDAKRILTPLGRQQAEYTGKRLREMLDGVNEEFGPCRIKVVRVSDMARAKETADIIASFLPDTLVERALPDPDLNEGRPSHNIPGGKASPSTIEKTDESHPRIEAAFRRYFYRAPEPAAKKSSSDSTTSVEDDGIHSEVTTGPSGEVEEEPIRHEFEVIVCHANVIRYFLCR
jgi:serine/threonine-protein phosphatase PGAM5